MNQTLSTDVAIIGAGTAGLYALREVRRAGKDFLLIDSGPLGTTCARVGCMPSKVALHAGAQWAARHDLVPLGAAGVEQLRIDLSQTWGRLRQQRDAFANGAAESARRSAKEKLLLGRARFVEPTVLQVTTPQGIVQVSAKAVVIANGSHPVLPDWLAPVRERTITTDQIFELDQLPASIGILGLGAIGLEMGAALARLGVRVYGADLAPVVAGITDPEIAARAQQIFGQEMQLWLGQKPSVEPSVSGVLLRSGEQHAQVELLLAALGRRPNTDDLNLEAAGVALDKRGAPQFDPATMRIEDLPLFIAGDCNAERPLMHEAADQGSMAGFNAARDTPTRFQRKVALGIAFTDPDIVTVGARHDQLEHDKVLIGRCEGKSNGRAQILGADASLLRVYADAASGRLLGAAMVAARGEHLAHLLAWAIQRGETATELLAAPYYHPTVEEMLQTALQDIVRQQKTGSALPFGLMAASEPAAPQ